MAELSDTLLLVLVSARTCFCGILEGAGGSTAVWVSATGRSSRQCSRSLTPCNQRGSSLLYHLGSEDIQICRLEGSLALPFEEEVFWDLVQRISLLLQVGVLGSRCE